MGFRISGFRVSGLVGFRVWGLGDRTQSRPFFPFCRMMLGIFQSKLDPVITASSLVVLNPCLNPSRTATPSGKLHQDILVKTYQHPLRAWRILDRRAFPPLNCIFGRLLSTYGESPPSLCTFFLGVGFGLGFVLTRGNEEQGFPPFVCKAALHLPKSPKLSRLWGLVL